MEQSSPDGGFLQSEEWRKFQEAVGRKTYEVSSFSSSPLGRGCRETTGEGFYASIIEHELPVVGKYFYIPRGPVIGIFNDQTEKHFSEIISLAKNENAGWIRLDANNEEILKIISKAELFQNQSSALKIKNAPHDMQPKEIIVLDIKKPEEQLLAEMKSKTRYNIKVAQKHNVRVILVPAFARINSGGLPAGRQGIQSAKLDSGSETGMTNKYIEEFLRLVKITTKRDKITPHPDGYYRKMFEIIPVENLKLYVAEFEGKIIAANIVVFYGKVATYLHGASDNDYRNVMAPYLLQWQAMLDAKKAGYEKYDMGGVQTPHPPTPSPAGRWWLKEPGDGKNNWSGITRFKTGFSIATIPLEFSGSYDIVINSFKYNLYRILQRIKALL